MEKTVAAHYIAMVPSGKVFDSSLNKGVPYISRVGASQVIKGLDEGILSMKVGRKWRLYISGEVRASTPDDMAGDVKTPQQRQELNASDNSTGTESLEGMDVRDGQIVQTESNSVHWSKRLEASRDVVDTKLGGMEITEALEVGSPVVIIEAPPMLKTAEPMPMMRPNTGIIKPGDAGRIIDRRPKDVWAVRFLIGAYLIDRRYFEPLEL